MLGERDGLGEESDLPSSLRVIVEPFPCRRMSPSYRAKPAMHRSSVDFPLPLGPPSAAIVPAGRPNDTSYSPQPPR